MHTRPSSLFVVALCLLAFALPACGSATGPAAQATNTPQSLTATAPAATASATQAPVSLRVINLPFIAFAPFWIAKDEGYFDVQGLQVELVDMVMQPDSFAAFLGGQVDVTAGLFSTSMINALAKGANFKIVADKGYIDPQGCNNIALIARKALVPSGEPTADQLKSKTLSLVRGTWNEYYLDRLFQTIDLELADLNIVNVPSPSVPEAMTKGSIDLVVNNEPWVTRLLDMGHRSILTPLNQLLPEATTGITVYGPKLLGENAEVGNRFMVAYLQAVRRYNEGKTERNIEIISKYANLDKELVKKMCWPALRGNGALNVDSLLDYQTWAQAQGQVQQPVAAGDLVDTRYLEFANQKLGPTTK